MNVLVTSCGTSEQIDNVRKVINMSTGRLGSMIANELVKSSFVDKVYYLSERSALKPDESKKITFLQTKGVSAVLDMMHEVLPDVDVVVHAMAISDYVVSHVLDENGERIYGSKISSENENISVIMNKAPKVISLIKTIKPEIKLIGFKLLSNVDEDKLVEAAEKLLEKNNIESDDTVSQKFLYEDIFIFVSSPNDIHPPFLPAWFDTIFVFCISIVISDRPNIHPPSPLEAVFSFNVLFIFAISIFDKLFKHI